MAEKSRSTNDLVPLLKALQEVQQRHSVDARTARDLIRYACLRGEFVLIIRRPDGSFEHLGPRSGVWEDSPFTGDARWRQMFNDGMIQWDYWAPGSRRRVQASELCPGFFTRASLSAFLGPEARSHSSAKPASEEDLKKFVAGFIEEAKAGGKTPTKSGAFKAARRGALPGATRERVFGEFERQVKAPPGRGRPPIIRR
jgi:hypothetical protein